MKKLVMVFVFSIIAFSMYGQTKNDDILKLLRLTGTEKLAGQIMDAMIPQFQELVPEVPSTFWEKFREKLDIDSLIYVCIPVYSKYYTHDEVKQLIAFYESPLGRRVVELTPFIMQETMSIGQTWGEKLGQDIVDELTKDGYI
jgi:hypothetical protein